MVCGLLEDGGGRFLAGFRDQRALLVVGRGRRGTRRRGRRGGGQDFVAVKMARNRRRRRCPTRGRWRCWITLEICRRALVGVVKRLVLKRLVMKWH